MNGFLSECSRVAVASARRGGGREVMRRLLAFLRQRGPGEFDPVVSIVNLTAEGEVVFWIKPRGKVSNARLGTDLCLTLSKCIK